MTDRHDKRPPFGDHDADAFVDGVLGRTTGRACGQALDRMDTLLDGDLHGLDRQLVQSHLEHCAGCREVAVALGWLGPLLPRMAELDPGPAFTDAVLARTTRSRVSRSVPARPRGLAGLMDRIGRWWEGQILRPAFATQAAYVATVLIVLATQVPGSPLRGVPGRALEVVTAGPAAIPVFGPALVDVNAWVENESAALATSGRERASAGRQSLGEAIGARNERSAAHRQDLATHLAAVVDRARAGSMTEAGYEILAASRSARSAWSAWWHDESASDNHNGP